MENRRLFVLLGLLLLSTAFLGGNAQGTRDSYDFIIVGAGSAGSVVAGELADSCKRCSILLIEAGGDATNPNVHNALKQSDLAFGEANSYLRDDHVSVPSANYHDVVIWGIRGKMLGGSFGVNAMFHVVGDKTDWDLTAQQVGDNKWNWANTDKYRKKVRKDFNIFEYDKSIPGFNGFVSAAQDIGLTHDKKIEDGIYGIGAGAQIGTFNPARPGGIRQTSYDVKILKPNHKNVEVLTHYRVSKVFINSQKVATGVQAINVINNQTIQFSATREIILSAGAYRTPQILMLSGIGPKAHLQSFGIPVVQDLPAVGSNLEDHLGIQTYWENKVPNTPTPFLFAAPSFNIFGPGTGRPRFQFEVSPGFISVTPLNAQSKGTVRLASDDPLAQAVITYNITSFFEDEILVGVKTILFPYVQKLRARNITGAGYTAVQPGATDNDVRQHVRQTLATNFHPTGTARVGSANDASAVVDTTFKVRGIKNLRVVDASVFRIEPTGNINSPTLALAYFAADVIGKEKCK